MKLLSETGEKRSETGVSFVTVRKVAMMELISCPVFKIGATTEKAHLCIIAKHTSASGKVHKEPSQFTSVYGQSHSDREGPSGILVPDGSKMLLSWSGLSPHAWAVPVWIESQRKKQHMLIVASNLTQKLLDGIFLKRTSQNFYRDSHRDVPSPGSCWRNPSRI